MSIRAALAFLSTAPACAEPVRPILFTSQAPGAFESVYELPSTGGAPRLVVPGGPEFAANLAVRSPDGNHVALVREFADSTILFLADSAGRTGRRPGQGQATHVRFPDWAPDSRSLLFVAETPSQSQGGMWLLDIGSGRLDPVALDSALYRCPSWAPDGERFVVSRHLRGETALLEVELRGAASRVLARSDSTYLDCPQWSPARNEILFTIYHGSVRPVWERWPATDILSSLAILDLASGRMRTVVTPSSITNYGRWSRDGAAIVFQSDRHASAITDPAHWTTRLDSLEIYAVAADGAQLRRLTRNGHYDAHPSW